MAPKREFFSGKPILLSPHQNEQISVSLSMGICATSVEDLLDPDCRESTWGQMHLTGFCNHAVLCTFQYGVFTVESGLFCFLPGILWRSCTRYKPQSFFDIG